MKPHCSFPEVPMVRRRPAGRPAVIEGIGRQGREDRRGEDRGAKDRIEGRGF